MKPTVMLVGLGGLGSVLLELLAREVAVGHIVVASRDPGRGVARCNLARLSAMAQGCTPSIRFVALDLRDTDATAETIQRETPDLIISTATLQAWWLPSLLPVPQEESLKRAGFGMWLPVHLTLTRALMLAVRKAGYAGHTLTAPYPDVVNPVLARLGLAPTCGVGNLDEVVPKLRLLTAERLGAPLDAIRLWFVAHHALEAAAFGEPIDAMPPYFLRIERDGHDVTEQVRAAELLRVPYPITAGIATNFLTAGSAARLIRALLSNDESHLHAPGPGGLPGGYPIVASRAGVRPEPIPSLSLDEAIAINERSHRFDGIECIEPDGTVVFHAQSVDAFRRLLGYDCARLPPGDVEDRASELMARFRAFTQQHGVTLPA